MPSSTQYINSMNARKLSSMGRDRNNQFVNSDIKSLKRFDEFTTIDWVEDELINHKISNNNRINLLKSRLFDTNWLLQLYDSTQNWIVLAIMGIIIGIIAGLLNIITAWLASLRMGHCKQGFYLNERFCCWGQGDSCDSWQRWSSFEFVNYLTYIAISLIFSICAVTLILKYSPAAAGSGISEIKCIVSGFVMRGFLSWTTLIIKSIGLPLAISSGLSVGKEGPSVHYAVCVGNSVAKIFKKYRQLAVKAREFLTATSAAGVAVAFGLPMGGVLFAMEEISSSFQLLTIFKSYFCSLVAVSTLASLNPFRTGQLVMFEVVYDTNWHYFDIPLYIILGCFGGLYGIVVAKFNIMVVSFRKRYLANHAVKEVIILTILTSFVCYFNQFVRVDMTELMQILFNECKKSDRLCNPENKVPLVVSLLFATSLRVLLTIVTYGCKVPAGIFVPSMAAGATFGRALGILMQNLHDIYPDLFVFSTCDSEKCVIPGTYAFLGAAAALSGITHLTVTVVVIMFELTGAIRYIIPTMIVVVVTKSIGDKWGPREGIADQMIKFNGLPFIDPKEDLSETNHLDLSVTTAMSNKTIVFPVLSAKQLTLGKLKSILKSFDYKGFPLVKDEKQPKIVGYVSRSDILYILENHSDSADTTVCSFSESIDDTSIQFKTIINPCPLTINSQATLEYVTHIFVKLGPRYLLVEENGNLTGLITRKDVLRYTNTHSDTANHPKIDEQFEEKVWEILLLFGTNIKKNVGKLFYNDATRFL